MQAFKLCRQRTPGSDTEVGFGMPVVSGHSASEVLQGEISSSAADIQDSSLLGTTWIDIRTDKRRDDVGAYRQIG